MMVTYAISISFLLIVILAVTVIVHRHLHLWLFAYIWQRLCRLFAAENSSNERHIIIAICDHFDFGSSGKYRQGEEDILAIWEKEYPSLSDRHRDSNGINLKHTWFFPPHYHRGDYLESLVALCSRGYGEIEMHLHHDHMPPFPDTSDTLREKLRMCIESYGKHGVFCLPDGTKTFAFIHGDWALDNSRGGKYCGVNDEIKILAEEGCYADFTFPSLHESQPRKINSIYYVEDDPQQPKSYDNGVDVRVGGRESGDLMLIQGPLEIRLKKKFGIPFFPAIEAAELEGSNRLCMERMNAWLKAHIHVKGKPEWIFVKLHTHGAMKGNYEHNFGEMADRFFTELENKYNNPKDGYLHYVTTREMFNIIRAAEAGETGNPGVFRDYRIPRYGYLP
jgi:hypothetical protein